MNQNTVVKATKPGGKGELREIRIEPADNGFVIETRHKMVPKDKNDMMMMDYDAGTTRSVCGSPEELGDHIMDIVGGKKSGYKADTDKDGK